MQPNIGNFSSNKMPASILIVDDESGIRESLGALLRDEGYDVEAVASGEECLERLEQRTFDLLLLDVWLKKMDGLAGARADAAAWMARRSW